MTITHHHHGSIPPPDPQELADAGVRVGWIERDAIVFRGFRDESEAANAAWAAHRALVQHVVEAFGSKSAPLEMAQLLIATSGTQEVVCADGREIATLLPPGSDPRLGRHFGFRLRVPAAHDAQAVRAAAHAIYAALRSEAVPWTSLGGDPQRTTRRPEPRHARASIGIRLARLILGAEAR